MYFDLNSKYFTQVSGGGYNKCILGNNSTNKEKNRQTPYSVLPNCVGFVYGASLCLANKTEIKELPTCNAVDWAKYLNWEKGTTPKFGAIIVWSGNTYGHVAVVIETYADGSFKIAESGWSSFYYRERVIPSSKYYGSGLTFKTFLYNPYIKEEKKAETKTETNKITEVEALAIIKKYCPKGYLYDNDKNELVGKIADFMYKMFPAYTDKRALGNLYGKFIKASILEFQKRVGMSKSDCDGYVGKKTLVKLYEYGFSV